MARLLRRSLAIQRYPLNRIIILLWLVYVVFNSVSLSAEESPVRLEKVSVHLYLENTGTLSEDVTAVSGFYAQNFRPFGTGFSDNDRFSSFLIKVSLSSDVQTFQPGEQARVIVKSEKTGKMVFELPIKGVLIGGDRRTVKTVLVSGYGCEPLVVEVQGRPKSITKMLPFKCSE
jgi:hypothetical protein